MIWIKQCWNTDLEGDLPELLLIWHQHQCKSYDNTLVNVPIQTASACSGMWVFGSLDDWKNHNKKLFLWPATEVTIDAMQNYESKALNQMGCLTKPKSSCYRGDRKICSSERNQYLNIGTDISKYFPQKTITKSWGCYKPNKCCIFPEKPMCIECVLKLHATLSHAEQPFSVKRNTDI